jgi:hypothetical protein
MVRLPVALTIIEFPCEFVSALDRSRRSRHDAGMTSDDLSPEQCDAVSMSIRPHTKPSGAANQSDCRESDSRRLRDPAIDR